MKIKTQKKIFSMLLTLVLAIGLIGCGTEAKTGNAGKTTKAKPKVKVTAQSISDKLKEKEGSYMTEITVVTAENDENKLLGRPNEYTEKITWKDNRIKDSETDCSIELFKNKEDVAARKKYLEGVIKAFPAFTQYITQKDNVLLRIEGALSPAQAKEYTDIFNK